MNFRQLTVSVALLIASVQTLQANNTYFLPGDAFFYARLDLKAAQELSNFESPILHYGDVRNAGFGCGHIGYQKIELVKMSDATKTALADAYRQFQDAIEADPQLGGKMSVFIYSNDYEWKKHGLGLQYNENWVAESVAFGAAKDRVRLESFVEQTSSLMKSWRDSTLVAKLPTKNPELPVGHKQAWTNTPVSIDCSQCRILIIPNRKFDSYVTPTNGLELIEISGEKMTQFTRTNSKWIGK